MPRHDPRRDVWRGEVRFTRARRSRGRTAACRRAFGLAARGLVSPSAQRIPPRIPLSALRGSSALRRTPQRMASGGSPPCACPRAVAGASRWAVASMERRKAVRASRPWPSQSHAERDDNDVAPCGAPSPLAFLRRERGTPRARFKTRMRTASRA